jgi:hypothetical protein
MPEVIASPKPPANPPEKTQTGEFRAVVQPMLDEHDNKLTWRSVLIAITSVAVGTITAIIFVDNRVRAETDAGMQVQSAELKAVDARVTTLEKRFDRFDAKMDALLDAAHVPASKRPPRDGGDP